MIWRQFGTPIEAPSGVSDLGLAGASSEAPAAASSCTNSAHPFDAAACSAVLLSQSREVTSQCAASKHLATSM
jgi:hypothetical protein